jgi:hypothetical protein
VNTHTHTKERAADTKIKEEAKGFDAMSARSKSEIEDNA